MITALSGGIFTRGQTTTPLVDRAGADGAQPGAGAERLRHRRRRSRAPELAWTSCARIDTELDARRRRQPDDATGDRHRPDRSSTDVTLATVFPNTTLGNQLKQVAKVIKFNATSPALGLNRQIFFCQLGGFDTHQNQVNTQSNLLAQVSQAIKAFYDATVELGMEQQVTTFTLSDFGRTLQPAGTGAGVVGSDHAWGNHHFVVGGAVRGGDFYGVPGPNGTVFPVLQLSGPSDTDNRGRWIPTASVEQYAATLASWYGVAPPTSPSCSRTSGALPCPISDSWGEDRPTACSVATRGRTRERPAARAPPRR